MPADGTTTLAGRTPAVLARGVGLTAAVLAGAVAGHCLAGGHLPGPTALGAVGALVLVAAVLAARAAAVREAAGPAPRRSAHPERAVRVGAVLGAAALAVALHPVLAMLTARPSTPVTVVDPHAAHAAGTGTTGTDAAGADAAGTDTAGTETAGTGAPGADAEAADAAAAARDDLARFAAAGVDLDAVRAAGWDLDALVAAGLDGPTLAAVGLDPADEHAPHTFAGTLAAADRALAAADRAPAVADPPPAAPGAPPVAGLAPVDGTADAAGSAAAPRSTDPVVDAAVAGVARLLAVELGRPAAVALSLVVTAGLAVAALAVRRPRSPSAVPA